MKNKVNTNRVIIALCMDKERDEKLINYLNSKVNKSDFIRNVLNDKLLNEEGGVLEEDKLLTRTLLEVLTNLSSLSDKLISLSNNNLLYGSNLSKPQFIENIDKKRDVNNSIPDNIDTNFKTTDVPTSDDIATDDSVIDESDKLFSNVLTAIHGFQ